VVKCNNQGKSFLGLLDVFLELPRSFPALPHGVLFASPTHKHKTINKHQAMNFEELSKCVDFENLMTDEELVESETRTEVWSKLSELIEELEKRVCKEFLEDLGVLTPPEVVDLSREDDVVVGEKRKFEVIDLTGD